MIPKRTVSYASGTYVDTDGVKTSFATVAAPVALTVADWNGAVITAAGLLDLPRTITITRSSAADQYSVDPIVLTGLRGGATVTESLTPANNDGNDTLIGQQAFDFLTGIAIPTQGGTGGSFTVGVRDICAPTNGLFCGFEAAAAGNVALGYGGIDSAACTNTDIIPVPAVAIGFCKAIQFRRVISGSMGAIGITLYIP